MDENQHNLFRMVRKFDASFQDLTDEDLRRAVPLLGAAVEINLAYASPLPAPASRARRFRLSRARARPTPFSLSSDKPA